MSSLIDEDVREVALWDAQCVELQCNAFVFGIVRGFGCKHEHRGIAAEQ